MPWETNDPDAALASAAADYAAVFRQLLDDVFTKRVRVIACQRTDPRSVSQAVGDPASAKALAKRETRQTG